MPTPFAESSKAVNHKPGNGKASGPFLAHNIDLGGGRQTLPGKPLLADTAFTRAVMRTLELVFAGADRSTIRIVDLGCLEGGYAVEFARVGFDSIGLEVRQANLDKCLEVAENLKLPNLRFVKDDARNISAYGPFDAVFCAGLLYHLDHPVAFLHALTQVTGKVLVLDTHVAMNRRPRYWRKRLSRMAEHEGVKGRWFDDYPDAASEDAVEGALTASYGNPKSFWVEKMHLLQVLRETGFSTVYEQFDCLANMVANIRLRRDDRVLIVAIRPQD